MIFFLLLAKALITAATATAVVAVVVAITYSAIQEWFEPRTVSSDKVLADLRREMNNAVTVTIGIRSKDGRLKETKEFKGDALSDDMKAKFAGRDRIVLKG
jgi:hypothetical protein